MKENINDYIENELIPKHSFYIRDKGNVERAVSLKLIKRLISSNEEVNYIVNYLTNNGFVVKDDQPSIKKPVIKTKSDDFNISDDLRAYMINRDSSIKNVLINKCMFLVDECLNNNFSNYLILFNDLRQAGIIGLIEAIDNYKVYYGNPISYINKRIIKCITQELCNFLGISQSELFLYDLVKKNELEYEELVVNKDLTKLSSNVGDKSYEEIGKSIMFLNPVSYEEIMGDEDETIYDIYCNNDSLDFAYNCETKEAINNTLKSFSESDKKIIELRYGLNGNKIHTIHEIAEILDLSSSTIYYKVMMLTKELSRKNKIKELVR